MPTLNDIKSDILTLTNEQQINLLNYISEILSLSPVSIQDCREARFSKGKICPHCESHEVFKYGIISGKEIDERLYMVNGVIEKPEINKSPSDMAILGRYIITPEIFEILETLPPGKNGEVQLTDALRMLSKKEAMYAYDFDGVRYDVGDKLGFLKATVDFALKRPNLQNDFIQYLREVCDKFDKKTTEIEQ